MTPDDRFMFLALKEAAKGLGRTAPNPAVGAVLVRKGRVVAKGFHRLAGGPHAEIEVFEKLKKPAASLRNAILYVTLEPCCHQGRTPPCTEAILKSGVGAVVVGMTDPDPKVSGKGMKILRRKGVRIRRALETECREFYRAYSKHRQTGRPFVTLKAACTADGMIASKTGRPRWISSAVSRLHAHRLRDRSDAILVGAGTIQADNPRLTTRLASKKGRDPVRVVLDSSLKLSPQARIFHLRSPAPTWIATTLPPRHPRVAKFQKAGASFLFCRADRSGRVDLKDLLRQLGRRGIVSLLVEGGSRVYASFLKRRLADHLILYLAPCVLGAQGVPFIPPASRHPAFEADLQNMTSRPSGPDLILEGRLA